MPRTLDHGLVGQLRQRHLDLRTQPVPAGLLELDHLTGVGGRNGQRVGTVDRGVRPVALLIGQLGVAELGVQLTHVGRRLVAVAVQDQLTGLPVVQRDQVSDLEVVPRVVQALVVETGARTVERLAQLVDLRLAQRLALVHQLRLLDERGEHRLVEALPDDRHVLRERQAEVRPRLRRHQVDGQRGAERLALAGQARGVLREAPVVRLREHDQVRRLDALGLHQPVVPGLDGGRHLGAGHRLPQRVRALDAAVAQLAHLLRRLHLLEGVGRRGQRDGGPGVGEPREHAVDLGLGGLASSVEVDRHEVAGRDVAGLGGPLLQRLQPVHLAEGRAGVARQREPEDEAGHALLLRHLRLDVRQQQVVQTLRERTVGRRRGQPGADAGGIQVHHAAVARVVEGGLPGLGVHARVVRLEAGLADLGRQQLLDLHAAQVRLPLLLAEGRDRPQLPHRAAVGGVRGEQRARLHVEQARQVGPVVRGDLSGPPLQVGQVHVRGLGRHAQLAAVTLLTEHRAQRLVAQDVQRRLLDDRVERGTRLLVCDHLLGGQHHRDVGPGLEPAHQVAHLHRLERRVAEAAVDPASVTEVQLHQVVRLVHQHLVEVGLPASLQRLLLAGGDALHLLQRLLLLLRRTQRLGRGLGVDAAGGEPPARDQRLVVVTGHLEDRALEVDVVRPRGAGRLVRRVQELHLDQRPVVEAAQRVAQPGQRDRLPRRVRAAVEHEAGLGTTAQQVDGGPVGQRHRDLVDEPAVELGELHQAGVRVGAGDRQHQVLRRRQLLRIEHDPRAHRLRRLLIGTAGRLALGGHVARTHAALRDAVRRTTGVDARVGLEDLVGDPVVPRAEVVGREQPVQQLLRQVGGQHRAGLRTVEGLVQAHRRLDDGAARVEQLVHEVLVGRVVQLDPRLATLHGHADVLQAGHRGGGVELDLVGDDRQRHLLPLLHRQLRQHVDSGVRLDLRGTGLLDARRPARQRLDAGVAAGVAEQLAPLGRRPLQPRLVALLLRLGRQTPRGLHPGTRDALDDDLHPLDLLGQLRVAGLVGRNPGLQVRDGGLVVRVDVRGVVVAGEHGGLEHRLQFLRRGPHLRLGLGEPLHQPLPHLLAHHREGVHRGGGLPHLDGRVDLRELTDHPEDVGQLRVVVGDDAPGLVRVLQRPRPRGQLADVQLVGVPLEGLLAGGALDHRGVQVLRLLRVAVDGVVDVVARHQRRQAHVDDRDLADLVVDGVLEHRGEHDRTQQVPVLRLCPRLDELLGGQPLPVDLVAVAVHEGEVVHRQQAGVAGRLLHRVGGQAGPGDLLGRAELQAHAAGVVRAVDRNQRGRLALVGHVRHRTQQARQVRPLHGRRAQRRPEVPGEVDGRLQVLQQVAGARVLVGDGVAQLRPDQVVRRLTLDLRVRLTEELARLRRELGDRGALLRRREQLLPPTLRHARVDLRHVTAPRRVRGLVRPQLVVDEPDERVHVLRGEQLLHEPLVVVRAGVLGQPVHQLVHAVGEPVVLAVQVLARVGVVGAHARAPRGDQGLPEQLHLRLGRLHRQHLVHPAGDVDLTVGGDVVHRVDRGVRDHRQERTGHLRVLVQHLLPRSGRLDVDLAHAGRLVQLRQPLPQRLRGLVRRVADPAADLAVVPADLRVAGLQQRIGHRLVRRDRGVALHVLHVVREVVAALLAVQLLVGGVQAQQPAGLLLVVVGLVDVRTQPLRHGEVLAVHRGVHTEQLVERPAAEHLGEHLAVVHLAVLRELGLRVGVGVVGAHVLQAGLLGVHRLQQQPPGQRHVAPVLLALDLRDHQVRQQRQRRTAAVEVRALRRGQRHQLRRHRLQQHVLGEQRLQVGARLARVQRLVELRHLLLDRQHLLGRQLRGVDLGVVQRLPLAEQVRPEHLEADRLRHRGRTPGTHPAHLGVGGDRADDLPHRLRLERRGLRELEGLELAVEERVDPEPRVRQVLVRQLRHLGGVLGGEGGHQPRLRIPLALRQLAQELLLHLLRERHALGHQLRVEEQAQLLEHTGRVADVGLHRGVPGRLQQRDLLLLEHPLHHVHRVGQRTQQVLAGTERAEHVVVHVDARRQRDLVAVEVAAHRLRRAERHLQEAVRHLARARHRHLRQQPLERTRVVGRVAEERQRGRLRLRHRQRVAGPVGVQRLQRLVQVLGDLHLTRRGGALGVELGLVPTHAPEDLLRHLDRLLVRGQRVTLEQPGLLTQPTQVPLEQVGHRVDGRLHHVVVDVVAGLRDHVRAVQHHVRGVPLARHLRVLGVHHPLHVDPGGHHVRLRALGNRLRRLLQDVRRLRGLRQHGVLLGPTHLLPVRLRDLRQRLQLEQLVRLVPAPAVGTDRAHAGTDRHAGTHRTAHDRGLGDLLQRERLLVRHGLQRNLETFLRRLAEGVEQHRLAEVRPVRNRLRRLVQVVCGERTGARAQLGRAPRRHRLHQLRRGERLDAEPVRHLAGRIGGELEARQRLDRPVLHRLLAQRRPRVPRQAAAHPELQHVDADLADPGERADHVELAVLVEEDVVERTRALVEGLAATQREGAGLARDHAAHRALEGNATHRGGELQRRTTEARRDIHARPDRRTHEVAVLVGGVEGALVVALHTPGVLGRAMHHLLQRVGELAGQLGVRLQPGRVARPPRLTIQHLGLDLAAGRHVLDLVPVPPGPDSTGDTAEDAAGQRSHRAADQEPGAGTEGRTTDGTSTRDARVVRLAPLVLRVLDAGVELAARLERGHVALHLLTLLRHRHPVTLLLRRHHQRRHDLVRALRPVPVVQVPDLRAVGEHVTGTHHLVDALVVLAALVDHRDAVAPVEEVAVGLALVHRTLVVRDEPPHELVVPRVLRRPRVRTRLVVVEREVLTAAPAGLGRTLGRGAAAGDVVAEAEAGHALPHRALVELPEAYHQLPSRRGGQHRQRNHNNSHANEGKDRSPCTPNTHGLPRVGTTRRAQPLEQHLPKPHGRMIHPGNPSRGP